MKLVIVGALLAALPVALCVTACADDVNPHFVGIGIQIEQVDTDAGKMVRVTGVLDDGPGMDAGLKTGDTVTHVNGTSIADMALVEVVKRIRGEAGTKVVLTVSRDGADAPLDFEITRGVIEFAAPGNDGLAAERAEGFARMAQAQAQGEGIGGPDGRVRVFTAGMMLPDGGQADMVTTDTHVFVLRGNMLRQFEAEGMELVWERDLRTAEELELADKRVTFASRSAAAKITVQGAYLYVLRNYMLHQFRLEDMEELATIDLRSDEEKERMERMMQNPPRIHRVRPQNDG